MEKLALLLRIAMNNQNAKCKRRVIIAQKYNMFVDEIDRNILYNHCENISDPYNTSERSWRHTKIKTECAFGSGDLILVSFFPTLGLKEIQQNSEQSDLKVYLWRQSTYKCQTTQKRLNGRPWRLWQHGCVQCGMEVRRVMGQKGEFRHKHIHTSYWFLTKGQNVLIINSILNNDIKIITSNRHEKYLTTCLAQHRSAQNGSQAWVWRRKHL